MSHRRRRAPSSWVRELAPRLPSALTSFTGRRAELAAIDTCLRELVLAASRMRALLGLDKGEVATQPADERAVALQVSPSGRKFRLPMGERVDLSTRGPLRRILAALAEQRDRAPGEALSRDLLVATGWPGERLGAEAAANRVYAAVATLRRMGLQQLLVRHDDGYLLDPSVPLDRRE